MKETLFAGLVRAARSGGQDVRAPSFIRKNDLPAKRAKSPERMTTKSGGDAIFTAKFKTGSRR
jgi:hypothetical protein